MAGARTKGLRGLPRVDHRQTPDLAAAGLLQGLGRGLERRKDRQFASAEKAKDRASLERREAFRQQEITNRQAISDAKAVEARAKKFRADEAQDQRLRGIMESRGVDTSGIDAQMEQRRNSVEAIMPQLERAQQTANAVSGSAGMPVMGKPQAPAKLPPDTEGNIVGQIFANDMAISSMRSDLSIMTTAAGRMKTGKFDGKNANDIKRQRDAITLLQKKGADLRMRAWSVKNDQEEAKVAKVQGKINRELKRIEDFKEETIEQVGKITDLPDEDRFNLINRIKLAKSSEEARVIGSKAMGAFRARSEPKTKETPGGKVDFEAEVEELRQKRGLPSKFDKKDESPAAVRARQKDARNMVHDSREIAVESLGELLDSLRVNKDDPDPDLSTEQLRKLTLDVYDEWFELWGGHADESQVGKAKKRIKAELSTAMGAAIKRESGA